MAHISLFFESGKTGYSLVRIVVEQIFLDSTTESIRGSFSHTRGVGSFPWTRAVRGVSLLFLRHKLSLEKGGVLAGGSGSLAASVDYAISKNPRWLDDMFGSGPQGNSYIRKLIKRINPERKRGGDVVLMISPDILRSQDIWVSLDGVSLNEMSDISLLISHLEGNVEDGRSSLSISKNKQIGEVLLLSTASLRRPYFAELLEAAQLAFEKRFGTGLYLNFKAVLEAGEYRTDASLVTLVKEMERSRSEIKALVVIPTWGPYFADGVACASSMYKLPVVSFTLPFDDYSPFLGRGLKKPPVVMSDNRTGARQLGVKAAGFLSCSNPESSPLVYIIPGHRGRIDSEDRMKGFSEGFLSVLPRAETKRLNYCDWGRKRTRDEIREVFATNNRVPDVVFAANDQMALGVRDFLDLHVKRGRRKEISTIVCGYDAEIEFREHLLLGCPYLFGTVGQRYEELARMLAKVVDDIVGGQQHFDETFLIEPEILVRSVKTAGKARLVNE